MRILLSSHLFHPSIGGIEQVSAMLAESFDALGHEVKIVTQTLTSESDAVSYETYRRPKPMELLRLVKWCDVCFHNNISLGVAWPLLFIKRPWVISHQTWITREDGTVTWRDCLKRFVLSGATNIVVSKAIADNLGKESVVIGNPYRDELFYLVQGGRREMDLVFVGRLVSDKGVDLLIEALGILKEGGLNPALTVIGTGPELQGIQELAVHCGVAKQVSFLGAKTGSALAMELHRHQIIVIPSRWNEPFGIVALEGIACGCVAIGSSGGGLSEAIGPCGRTFRNGNAAELSEAISDVLRNPGKAEEYRAHRATHLNKYRRDVVAALYLEVFEGAMSI